MDYPVASMLAAKVVSEHAYEPVTDDTWKSACAVMDACRYVLCPCIAFGPLNEANERLRQRAGLKLCNNLADLPYMSKETAKNTIAK